MDRAQQNGRSWFWGIRRSNKWECNDTLSGPCFAPFRRFLTSHLLPSTCGFYDVGRKRIGSSSLPQMPSKFQHNTFMRSGLKVCREERSARREMRRVSSEGQKADLSVRKFSLKTEAKIRDNIAYRQRANTYSEALYICLLRFSCLSPEGKYI